MGSKKLRAKTEQNEVGNEELPWVSPAFGTASILEHIQYFHFFLDTAHNVAECSKMGHLTFF